MSAVVEPVVPRKSPRYTKDNPHWTQTRKGRAQMRALAKKRHAAKGAKRHAHHRQPKVSAHEEANCAYASGYISCWLDIYAASSGVPRPVLAQRVGAVLHRTASGPVLRAEHPLPRVR